MTLFWTFYIPIATITFILLFVYLIKINQGKWEVYYIEKNKKLPHHKKEKYYTIIAIILFSGVGLLCDYIHIQKWDKIYYQFQLLDIFYIPFSAAVLLLINDIYFYLTHRLLHGKLLFKYVHQIHHRSKSITPWSAFSFHPIESVIQIMIIPIFFIIIPVHFTVLIIVSGFLLFMSVYGHTRYELRAKKGKWLFIFNTSTHHFQHHEYVHYNYGLYLNIWDQIFKTNHKAYTLKLSQKKKS